MSAHEKILYFLFKKSSKPFKLGNRAGTPIPTNVLISRDTAAKTSPEWETKDLYYDMKDEDG